MIRSFAIAAAAFLSLAPLAAQADDFVVIESSAPGVQVGTTVASGTRLTLPDKTRLVLVASSGQVFTLTGPFQGPPPSGSGAAQSDASGVLKILPTLLGNNDQRETPGVVRGTDVAWRNESARSLTDVLAINATDGGDVCLYDPSHAEVVHNPSNGGTMTIHAMSGDAAIKLDWKTGVLSQPWPSSLPLANGATYLFEQSGQDAAAVATIHLLRASPSANDVQRVTQMAQAGCNDQAKLLLALVAKTAR